MMQMNYLLALFLCELLLKKNQTTQQQYSSENKKQAFIPAHIAGWQPRDIWQIAPAVPWHEEDKHQTYTNKHLQHCSFLWTTVGPIWTVWR